MRQLIRAFVFSFVILFTAPVLAQAVDLSKTPAGPYALDKSHASLTFRVSHLGFSMFTGRFDNLFAKLNLDPLAPEKSAVEASVYANSVNTNVEKLDEHLKSADWLKVEQFPMITFKSTGVSAAGSKAKMVGDLTLLGVTKPVTFDVTLRGAGMNPFAKLDTVGFAATTTIKRSEWGLKTYLPAIGDDVELSLEAEFNYAGPPIPPPAPVDTSKAPRVKH